MKKLLYISVLFLFGMTSCIQDYLDDGGTHSAESNTTPYEYLSSHTYHMFDTLIQISMVTKGGPIPSTRSIVILPPIRSGSIFSRIRSN